MTPVIVAIIVVASIVAGIACAMIADAGSVESRDEDWFDGP